MNLVSFQGVTVKANRWRVRDIIEALQKLHSKDGIKPASLREVSRIYTVSHQNLSNWIKGSKKQAELFQFIEKARKALGIDEKKAYRKSVKSKR